LFQIITNTATGGINNGIIKYTSEFSDQKLQLAKVLKATIVIILICTLSTSIFLLLASENIASTVLYSSTKSYIIKLTAGALIFYSINIIYTSYLNGIGKIKTLTIVNVLQSTFSLVITLFLFQFLHFDGILLSIPLSQIAIFIFLVIAFLSKNKILRIFVNLRINFSDIKKLLSYSIMTLSSAVISPSVIYYARSYIASTYGENTTGIWQASQYISTTHLFLLTTSLSVYFLPTFSRNSDSALLRREIFKGLKFIWVIVFISSIVLYLGRNILVELLFSKDFSELSQFIIFQIISDIIKITSWLFAYLMIAKNMIKHYILFEVTTGLVYIIALSMLIKIIGIKGIYVASIVQYSFYLLLMLFTFRKYFKFN
jgi:PST family polysaccharide transporter